ncbi:Hypothetical predicted protein, partial [Paramuricea clavata]
ALYKSSIPNSSTPYPRPRFSEPWYNSNCEQVACDSFMQKWNQNIVYRIKLLLYTQKHARSVLMAQVAKLDNLAGAKIASKLAWLKYLDGLAPCENFTGAENGCDPNPCLKGGTCLDTCEEPFYHCMRTKQLESYAHILKAHSHSHSLSLFSDSIGIQEKLRLNLHSLSASVSELLEYGRYSVLEAPFYTKFTHLGKTGCTGPTTIGANYDGQTHKDLTTVQNGIQYFTVPYTGVYTITAVGAAGGQDKSSSSYIGRGARVGGNFNLEKGQVLKILVGQVGKNNSPQSRSGGGGGSFVVTSSDVPLIIGGGGGGIASVTQMYSNADGNTGTAGKTNGGPAGSSSWSGGSGGYGATEADSSNSGYAYIIGITVNNGRSGTNHGGSFGFGGQGGFGFIQGGDGGRSYTGNGGGGFGGGGGAYGSGGELEEGVVIPEEHQEIIIPMHVVEEVVHSTLMTIISMPDVMQNQSTPSDLLPFDSIPKRQLKFSVSILYDYTLIRLISFSLLSCLKICLAAYNLNKAFTSRPFHTPYFTSHVKCEQDEQHSLITKYIQVLVNHQNRRVVVEDETRIFGRNARSASKNTVRNMSTKDNPENVKSSSVFEREQAPRNPVMDYLHSTQLSENCLLSSSVDGAWMTWRFSNNSERMRSKPLPQWRDLPGHISFTVDHGPFYAKFTRLGKTGRTGPNKIGTNYDGQAHKDLTTVQNGIQYFTVPYTGVYTITAVGAAGGLDSSSSSYRGRGARVGGDFNLGKGQVLKILVGQVGRYNSPYRSAGGGGGSFVATSSNVPLIIGGGGGGILSVTKMYVSAHGNTGPAGKPNGGSTKRTIWSGGSGGYGATEADNSNSGGGGGGFYSNGRSGTNHGGKFGLGGQGGFGFKQGGQGGLAYRNTGGGGFGGGGGAYGHGGGAGGGGGYSGGASEIIILIHVVEEVVHTTMDLYARPRPLTCFRGQTNLYNLNKAGGHWRKHVLISNCVI